MSSDHYRKQANASYHQQNLGGQNTKSEQAQILKTLSEVDDLPIQPQDDEIMGQLVSKLTSTANLTEEQVRANEWMREIVYLLYISLRPTTEGVHSHVRAYSHDSSEAALDPMTAHERAKWETLVGMSKLKLSRSEGAKVIEEGTRDVRESIVNDGQEEGGQSILSRLKGE